MFWRPQNFLDKETRKSDKSLDVWLRLVLNQKDTHCDLLSATQDSYHQNIINKQKINLHTHKIGEKSYLYETREIINEENFLTIIIKHK